MSKNDKRPTRSISQFLSIPQTSKFLEEQLKGKKSEFVSNLIALSDTDANLQACEPQALMKCAMNATALNLPLNKNLGYAYVIAYKNKEGVSIPQFQIGYKGLIQMAVRSGMYRYINATEVREGEIERNKFTGEIKQIGDYPENKIIGYISSLKLISGFEASVYMSEEDIEKHAMKYSKTYQNDKRYKKASSKWSDKEERPKMACKTVLKKLLGTYGVLSTEMMQAMTNDSEEETVDAVARDVTYEQNTIQEQKEPEAMKLKIINIDDV